MQDYEKGSLKMINLVNYINAPKETWIRRLIVNNSKYKTLFESKYTTIYSRLSLSRPRLSRSDNLVPVLIQRPTNRQQNIVEKRRNCF